MENAGTSERSIIELTFDENGNMSAQRLGVESA